MRLLLFLFLVIPIVASGQTVCSLESREKLEKTLVDLSKIDHRQASMNGLVLEIGTSFLGTPYVEKTLDLPGEEKLVIDFMGLDCTTFLESVVTLARLSKKGTFSFAAYEGDLEYVRYQEGLRKDYPSRLHYFSDWIYQNQAKGILEDVTEDIGGIKYENNPSFMSSNPKFYPQLSNLAYVDQLKITEAAIKSRPYFYIPKENIKSQEGMIQPGDLIAITTSMANLDVVHVGFAIEKNGRIHLLHASSKSMQVEISEKPLSDYLQGNKSQSGIIVSRLLEPEKSL